MDYVSKSQIDGLKKKIGFYSEPNLKVSKEQNERFIQYINLKLTALDYPTFGQKETNSSMELSSALLLNLREKNRLLSDYHCPADHRVQNFLNDYLKDTPFEGKTKLPFKSFILDQHGLARILSLPPDKNEFKSEHISSYRIQQGVLHNPKNDRRTTKGTFHVAEDGFQFLLIKRVCPK